MDKQKIYNQYANEQGYDSWEILCLNYIRTSNDRLIYHFNNVTDLIQEELKNKIHNELNGVHFYNRTYFEDCRKEILNTEIL